MWEVSHGVSNSRPERTPPSRLASFPSQESGKNLLEGLPLGNHAPELPILRFWEAKEVQSCQGTEARAIGIFYFLKKGQSGRNLSGKHVSWDISGWSLYEGTTKLPPSLGSLAPGMRAQHSPPSKDEQQRGRQGRLPPQ